MMVIFNELKDSSKVRHLCGLFPEMIGSWDRNPKRKIHTACRQHHSIG
jgi:hypothetical protein